MKTLKTRPPAVALLLAVWATSAAATPIPAPAAGDGIYPIQPVYAVATPVAGSIAPSARLALVIGNDEYAGSQALHNAGRDAARIADVLKSKGFSLIGDGETVQLNRTSRQMRALFDQLERAAANKPGALVVVYFAGHGTVAQGHNLLAPIDIGSARNNSLFIYAVSVNDVAERLHRARVALTVMFLDDCRDSNRADNEHFIPEQFPDNTFVGFSTRLGGMASDNDDSGYSAALAVGLSQGFDTLANLHLSLTNIVTAKSISGPEGVIQAPVFSVGRTMPAKAIQFFPPPEKSTEMERSQTYLNASIEQACDEASYAGDRVIPQYMYNKDITPNYVLPCKAAWSAGWRSKAVIRGYGLALKFIEYRTHAGDVSSISYLLQAAELGDATAAEDLLTSLMIGGGGSGDGKLARPEQDPTGFLTKEKIEFLENNLLRYGTNLAGVNVNNAQAMLNYALLKVLRSGDKNISFLWAELESDPSWAQRNGYSFYEDPVNLREARGLLVSLAESGYVPAVYMLALDKGEWIRGLPIRQYMERAVTDPDYGKPIKVNPNLSTYQSMTEQTVHAGSIGFLLLNDLMHGEHGPADPAAAVQLGRIIEQKSPYFETFDPRVRLIECYNFGMLLSIGRTKDGVRVPRDVADGLRLIRYAADHGMPEARESLAAAGLR